jgi:hypothetical protein
MIIRTIILSLFIIACSSTPKPTPHPPDDTPSCTTACQKMENMGCEEAQPAEDGTTCQKFCEDTQNSGHALNPSCIMQTSVRICADIQNICGQ